MEIDENGVVNPLRAPAFVRDGLRSVQALPPIALAFVALAAVDLIATVIEAHTLVPAFVARAATVLFPAALLWRRPDAAAVTPRLFGGAVVLAVAELAGRSINLVSSAIPVDDSFLEDPTGGWPRLAISAIVALTLVVGWALVASAIAALRSSGGGVARIMAALVAACALGAGAAIVFLGLQTTGGSTSATTIVAAVIGAATWIVVGYVGWVLVSRAGGLPRRATIAAAAGVTVQTIGSLPLIVIALGIQATQADDWIALQAVTFPILSAAAVLAQILFVFAFATGLGDPPAEPVAGPEGAIG